MKRLRFQGMAVVATLAIGSSLAACSSSSQPTANVSAASACWAKATSASECGGMAALVKAAKAEGHLNVIALPPDWANYGSIIKNFESKYGISVNSENPNGSSGEELAAIRSQKGSGKAPDVVDVGPSFALQGTSEGLFTPYRVATWSSIPADQKSASGYWWDDYGGYISIGYNAGIFHNAPTSFNSLLAPQYKGSVCLDGNPESAGAAFAGVFAAALANGGSFSNIEPGIQYFKSLAKAGNFVPTGASPSSIESGQCRVTIDWTYLEAQYAVGLKGKVDWKVFVPASGHYASYYVQAISKYAPDPAAARLWEEYLFSPAGQNGWLEGYAMPVELSSMISSGTVNKQALSAIPAVSGTPSFPSLSQLTKAQEAIVSQWPSV
ncbi:MAG: extracellular solute-binding protein [Actinobacteria bacterium]|nr:extracellular solute-binding protein [Actinomycetota bacterium]